MDKLLGDGLLLLFGAIVGGLVGRYWQQIDRKTTKDKEQVEKIIKIISPESEPLYFLRTHDFANSYRDGETESWWALHRLLIQPSYFFMNKNLEKVKGELLQEITDFQNLISVKIFVSDRNKGFWELSNPHDVITRWILFWKSEGKKVSNEEIT